MTKLIHENSNKGERPRIVGFKTLGRRNNEMGIQVNLVSGHCFVR